MFTKRGGFTLVELLIAFAIIAAISVAAAPIYSNYNTKFKVSNMLTIAQNAQMYVLDDYRNNIALANINYAANSTNFVSSRLAYISSIAIAAGVITVTGNPSYLGNRAITLTVTPTISTNTDLSWHCIVNNAQYYDLVPPGCKQTT